MIERKSIECVTFGCGKKFRWWRFQNIVNFMGLNKPSGGLWCSPVDAEFGWEWWGNIEGYPMDESFTFTVGGTIATIVTPGDVKELPHINSVIYKELDFEKMVADGIDAIHVKDIATVPNSEWHEYCKFHTWSCETILVLNRHVIS